GWTAFGFGLMGRTSSFFRLLGGPLLGRWSDRYGRRRILLVSELGTLVSWAVFLTAIMLPDLPLANIDSKVFGSFLLTVPLVALFVARALAGITGGSVSIAKANLADIS